MATVAEFELEQKASEFIAFVQDFFLDTNKKFYKSNTMFLYIDANNRITLEYEGK